MRELITTVAVAATELFTVAVALAALARQEALMRMRLWP
jgi:hypothetical protein